MSAKPGKKMRYEKSAGAVVFRKENNRVLFLLLGYEHKSKYLGFPRGNIEPGESEKQAAMREIKEETGLDFRFIEGFRETANWFYRKEGDTVNKSVILFLAEAGPGAEKISEEHVANRCRRFERP